MIAGKISLMSKVNDELVVMNDYYGIKTRRAIIERWEIRYGFEKYYIQIAPEANVYGVSIRGLNRIVKNIIDKSPCEDIKNRRPKAEYSNRTPFNILSNLSL